MDLNVYIRIIIRSYTKHYNHNIYKITENDIDLYKIVCKYIYNKISKKSMRSFVMA